VAEEVTNAMVDTTPPRIARYPRHPSAAGGAIAAVTLGTLGLVVAIFSKLPIMGLPLAVLGLLLGAWGTLSQRRGLAIVGLVLCLLAVVVSGTREAIQAYRTIYEDRPIDSTMEKVNP
jgi:hypothetical protein